MIIASTKNNLMKKIRSLHQKKYRQREGAFLLEGERIIEQALRAKANVNHILMVEGKECPAWLDNEDQRLVIVSEEVFASIIQTEQSQGIIAQVEIPKVTREIGNHVLMLDRIQDPGNLGTMIRTADAAGFSDILMVKGTVDPYNDKVLRSTMGSIFSVQLHTVDDACDTVESLKSKGYDVVGAALDGARMHYECEYAQKVCLIIGNEGNGIDKDTLALTSFNVKIPILGEAESLNAAIASSVLMYDVAIKHLKSKA